MPIEYPQIFVSWSSPDREIAISLIRRLKAQGLNIKEYGEAMEGGEPLQPTVIDWIAHSKIAVILYSEATAEREWIKREVAWCVYALTQGTLKRIIPIHLGPQSDPPVMPLGLQAMDLNARQLTPEQVTPETFLQGEAAMFALARSLFRLSGMDQFQIVPAAVFAMTRQRAEEVLVNSNVQVDGLSFDDYWRNLCRSLGMGRPPKLLNRLKERYGAAAGELRPFEKGSTIAQIVDERLEAVNEARKRKNRPPLFINWIQDNLRSNDQTVADIAADLWREHESLLIVDSLSTWDPEIRQVLEQRITDFGRSSLLWLPPYTQQIGALDEAIDQALLLVRRIRTEVRTVKDPTRAVSLEAMNQWAMNRWVHRVLLSVVDGLQPSEPAVNEMQKATDAPDFDPALLWRR